MCYRKLCEWNLPELTAEKAKLKITISYRKSTELLKSARSGTIKRHIYVPNFVWLQQALSLLRGVFISRPSVSMRYTDIQISIFY